MGVWASDLNLRDTSWSLLPAKYSTTPVVRLFTGLVGFFLLIFLAGLCCSSVTHSPETLTPSQDADFNTDPAPVTWIWTPQVNPSGLHRLLCFVTLWQCCLERPLCSVALWHCSCCLNSAPFQPLSIWASVWRILAHPLCHFLLHAACFDCYPLFTVVTLMLNSVMTLIIWPLCVCVSNSLNVKYAETESGLGLIYLCTCGVY